MPLSGENAVLCGMKGGRRSLHKWITTNGCHREDLGGNADCRPLIQIPRFLPTLSNRLSLQFTIKLTRWHSGFLPLLLLRNSFLLNGWTSLKPVSAFHWKFTNVSFTDWEQILDIGISREILRGLMYMIIIAIIYPTFFYSFVANQYYILICQIRFNFYMTSLPPFCPPPLSLSLILLYFCFQRISKEVSYVCFTGIVNPT